MLIRLFLGMPLPKGVPLHPVPPLVITTFQGQTFLGVRSKAGSPLFIDDLDLQYRYTQDLLYEAVPMHYKPMYKDISLIIFPEVLIGALEISAS
ncbi:hypothetical protein [Chlamydia sp. 17-3921]|uniref:hypothetical protein n=1 Tax=Chlamydia sp. 17-3921 TaxID=2675798 RepID=UPI001919882B|nr:hypothetical protein [Chlamydia sp. 17-3921]